MEKIICGPYVGMLRLIYFFWAFIFVYLLIIFSGYISKEPDYILFNVLVCTIGALGFGLIFFRGTKSIKYSRGQFIFEVFSGKKYYSNKPAQYKNRLTSYIFFNIENKILFFNGPEYQKVMDNIDYCNQLDG